MSPRRKLRTSCNKISTQTWNSWCRVCAKSDSGECENRCHSAGKELQANQLQDFNLSTAIEKFLGVNIYDDKELPQSVCRDCHSLLKTMMNLIHRTEKVQRMYADLKRLKTWKSKMELSTQDLLIKYGLVENQEHSLILNNEICTKERDICKINKMEEVLLKVENICDESEKVECLFNVDIEEEIKSNTESLINKINIQKEEGDPFDETELARNLNNADGELLTGNLTPTDIDWIDNTISGSKKSSDLLVSTSSKSKRRKYCAKKQNCDEEESITRALERFSCSECSQQFKSEASLNRHIDRIHAKTTNLSLSCNQCERTFTEQNKLKEHLDMHLPLEMRKIHSCKYCEKKMTSRNSLLKHIRQIHLNKQPFICHECGAALRTFDNLRTHLLTHLDYAPLVCHICQRRFKIRQSLRRHMKVHDPKKYDCPECGLQLKSILTLRTHMVVHSDEKPYKCKVCGVAFKRPKTLKNHEILHTGIKPYACDFCDRTFPISSALRTHKKNTHPVELATVEAAAAETIASGTVQSKPHPINVSK